MIVDPDSKSHKVSEHYDSTATETGSSLDPPPYTPPEAGPSEPRSGFQPRVNHLYVYEQNAAIKGKWLVDTSLKVPQSLLPEIPAGEERQNLKVQSHNGSTTAEITLAPSGDSKGRALLEVASHNGSAWARVVPRQNQKFRLKATSHNGAVTIKLPDDFEGPVSFSTCNGCVRFSPRLQAKLVTFAKDRKAGKAFIGDWESAGYGDGDHVDWKGDELIVGTKNGSLYVGFNDELTGGEMFFKTFKEEGAFAAMGHAFKGAFGRSKAWEDGWYDTRRTGE